MRALQEQVEKNNITYAGSGVSAQAAISGSRDDEVEIRHRAAQAGACREETLCAGNGRCICMRAARTATKRSRKTSQSDEMR